MTKAQLRKIVEQTNRPVRTQQDMIIAELLFFLTERISRQNGWNPIDFFKGGRA